MHLLMLHLLLLLFSASFFFFFFFYSLLVLLLLLLFLLLLLLLLLLSSFSSVFFFFCFFFLFIFFLFTFFLLLDCFRLGCLCCLWELWEKGKVEDFFTIFRLRRGEFGHLVWLADAGCGMVWGLEILENKGFRDPGAFGARMRCSEHNNFCHPKNGKRGENKGRESWPHYLPPVFRYFFAPFLAQILKTPKKVTYIVRGCIGGTENW